MKNIKTFKIFENKSKDIFDDCKYIFGEFIDNGASIYEDNKSVVIYIDKPKKQESYNSLEEFEDYVKKSISIDEDILISIKRLKDIYTDFGLEITEDEDNYYTITILESKSIDGDIYTYNE